MKNKIINIGWKEFRILEMVNNENTQSEIAYIFQESRAAISKIFKKLIDGGLVERKSMREYILTKNGKYYLNLYNKIK